MNQTLSLITSLYRSDKYIEDYCHYVVQAAYSVENRGIHLEIVIVANDATRKEKKYIAELLCRADSTSSLSIVPLFVPRESLYASWNRGIKESSGDYIGFWNADDIRNTDALIEGVEMIKAGAKLVYFPFINMHIRYVPKRRRVLPQFLSRNTRFADFYFPHVPEFAQDEFMRSMYCCYFFLVNRRVFETAGLFDEQFHITGDFEWCIRAAESIEFTKGRCVAGILVDHGSGLSGRGSLRHVVENNVIYIRYGIIEKIEDMDEVQEKMMREYRIESDCIINESLAFHSNEPGLKTKTPISQ